MKKLQKSEDMNQKQSTLVENCFDWASAAVVALIIISLVFSCLFRVVNVSGDSMNDTLVSGEKLLLSCSDVTPRYGDIVVIRRENDTPLIKRVIGLPGDEIFINDANGIVYRNGEPLSEAYVKGGRTSSKNRNPYYTVPEGGIFVLGDNRINSLDSRDLRDTITMDDVVGVITYRLSPFQSLRNGD